MAGSLVLVMAASLHTIAIGADQGRFTVNGVVCTAFDGAEATTAAVRSIEIIGTEGRDAVLVDFSAGGAETAFSSGASRVSIDLGEGSDLLMVRGGPGEDSWTAGERGGRLEIDVAGGAAAELFAANVEELVVSLGPGDDTFDGADSVASRAPVPISITLCGGAGQDWLRAGDGDDYLEDWYGTNDVDAGEGAGDRCSLNGAVPQSCEL
jgi:hypothetical protein